MRRADITILAFLGVIVTLLSASWLIRTKELEKYVECRQNLHRIGVALINYHETYESFPSGTICNPNLPPEQRLSWFITVMPYIEAKTPYVRTDKTEPWTSEKNMRLITGPYKPFLCPASNLRETTGPGLCSYVGIAGLGKDAAILPRDDPNAGVFGYDHSAALQDVRGRESLTMMATETMFDNGPWAAGGVSTVRGIVPTGLPLIGRGGQFGSHHSAISMLSTNLSSPANVLFVDGSVRPLPMSSGIDTVKTMATIKEHQPTKE